MENVTSTPAIDDSPPPGGLVQEAGWFLSGAVLPLVSLAFYRAAARRPVSLPVLFLFLFTSIMALLSSLRLGLEMSSGMDGIRAAYEQGMVPAILIEHGVARVDGREPVILLNQQGQEDSMLVAIDTTGQIQEIDRARYTQGFLLTRTELHMLSRGDYQVLALTDLHQTFERDPILINAQTVSQAWAWLSVIFVLTMLLVLIGWHFLVRLMFLAALSLLMWGIVSLVRPKTGYEPVLVTGIYASIPAIYVSQLLYRSDFSFPGMQTLLLIIFWAIALFASLADTPFISAPRPLRLWTAWLGVPMVVVFIIDGLFQFEAPYGPAALWGVTALTVLGIAGLRFYLRRKDTRPLETIPPA